MAALTAAEHMLVNAANDPYGPCVCTHHLGTIRVCQGDSGTGGHISKPAVLRGAGKAPGWFKMCGEICTVLPLLSLPVVS